MKETADALWGTLYIDDAGILQRVMTAMVTACAAFELAVAEAEAEIVCLRKEGGGVDCHCSRPDVHTQTIEYVCVYLGGAFNADSGLSGGGFGHLQRAWPYLRWYTVA